MAFLDNSGDIILDAVLTDTGRFRMARGDFRISKFALGDDEIDYSLYNKNHPSGSAYYDLEVLRTPLLEAFTNNTSTMKSKLITITRTNILYLPVLKLLNGGNASSTINTTVVDASATNTTTGGFVITVDKNTEDKLDTSLSNTGVITGRSSEKIRNTDISCIVERGLDTTEIAPAVNMPATLQETQFIIEMDHRLGSLVTANADQVPVSFIDDDQIASYYISENTVSGQGSPIVISKNTNGAPLSVDSLPKTNAGSTDGDLSIHNINGPRDTLLHFKIEPSVNLRASSYLFEKLGSTILGSAQAGFTSDSTSFNMIDTIIKITSATTGVSLDIPIRYIRKA